MSFAIGCGILAFIGMSLVMDSVRPDGENGGEAFLFGIAIACIVYGRG